MRTSMLIVAALIALVNPIGAQDTFSPDAEGFIRNWLVLAPLPGGGERIDVTAGVWMRVVRWNHSGDSAVNPEQHNPVELDAVPAVDPVSGGLHAGVADAFPNGGGNRA